MSALGVKVSRNNGASLIVPSAGSWYTVPFQRTLWEEGATFWDVGDDTKVTIPTTGWWIFTTSTNTGYNYDQNQRILIDGTTVAYHLNQTNTTKSPGTPSASATSLCLVYLEAGQYVELQVMGTATNIYVYSFGDYCPNLCCHYYGDGLNETVGAKISRATDYAYPGSLFNAIPHTAVDWDTDSFADLVSNDTRLTIPSGKDGVYLIGAVIKDDLPFKATTGHSIFVDGTTRVATISSGQSILDNSEVVYSIEKLTATQYVEVHGYMDVAGGSALAGDVATEMWIKKLDSAS